MSMQALWKWAAFDLQMVSVLVVAFVHQLVLLLDFDHHSILHPILYLISIQISIQIYYLVLIFQQNQNHHNDDEHEFLVL